MAALLQLDAAGQGLPRLSWKCRVHPTRPVSMQGLLVARAVDQGLLTLDPDTGCMRPCAAPPEALANVAMATDGRWMYLGIQPQPDEAPVLCAWDPQARRVAWTAAVLQSRGRHAWRAWTMPAMDDDRLFVTTDEHMVHALYAHDGTPAWTFDLPDGGVHRPTSTAAGGRLYVSGAGKAGFVGANTPSEGYVLALDGRGGELMWIGVTRRRVAHPAAVAGGRVCVGDHGSAPWSLHAYDEGGERRLRTPRWKHRLESLAGCGAVYGTTAYWGCYRGWFYAIDMSTGALRWRFRAGSSLAAQSSPCVIGSAVYAGCADGFVYGLDAGTGALRWKTFLLDDEAQDLAHGGGEGERFGITVPPLYDIEVWEAGGRLLALTSQGFLWCFELP